MDTLYNVYGPPNLLFSSSWGFFPSDELTETPPCSAGLNEWSRTFIRPYAFVVLVSLTTVFWLVFISVISTSYGSFLLAGKVMSGVELVTEWSGWRSVLLEKMVGAQLAKKFPAFY
jgi:hypothetical protein